VSSDNQHEEQVETPTPEASDVVEETPRDAESHKENGELNVLLEQAEARANDYLDSLQRERASFQNYKRRVEREKADQAKALAGNVVTKLLPVLDDFYRAMDAVPEKERDQWFEGITLILRKFERFLSDEGIAEIPALGEVFDPNFHEAIGVDESSDAESGTITAVLQKGYKHGDHVLRPALVRVAQ
jgi:molecular chaperone GrpE